MENTYCHFSSSGESWLSFPEPEDDSESEGISDIFSVLKFHKGLRRYPSDPTFTTLVNCINPCFLGENNNGLQARHATLLPKNGNYYDRL